MGKHASYALDGTQVMIHIAPSLTREIRYGSGSWRVSAAAWLQTSYTHLSVYHPEIQRLH